MLSSEIFFVSKWSLEISASRWLRFTSGRQSIVIQAWLSAMKLRAQCLGSVKKIRARHCCERSSRARCSTHEHPMRQEQLAPEFCRGKVLAPELHLLSRNHSTLWHMFLQSLNSMFRSRSLSSRHKSAPMISHMIWMPVPLKLPPPCTRRAFHPSQEEMGNAVLGD